MKHLYQAVLVGPISMSTRTRKTWKPGQDGQFTRQIGWQRTRSGKLGQVKFRLGSDLPEARRREMMLVQP